MTSECQWRALEAFRLEPEVKSFGWVSTYSAKPEVVS